MFQHVLVAIDGSESSLRAADIAIELAALFHATLDLLSVEETPPRYVSTQEEQLREHSAAVAYFDRLHAPLRSRAEGCGIATRCAVISGHEGQAMLQYIEEQHCDLLVLGYRGHSGVWGGFLGSTADKLVSHASCSTLVIRPLTGRTLFKQVLVALDGSPLSWQAFSLGLQMAKLLNATLQTVSVIEGSPAPPISDTLPQVAPSTAWDWSAYFQKMQVMASAQAQVANCAVETLIVRGSASSSLVSLAREQQSDLLLLGATGQEHPWSAVTGGTARKIANAAPCAVLVVRPSSMQRRVRDVMQREVTTIKQQTSLPEIMTLLIEQEVRMLVVVDDERHIQGIITLGHLLATHEHLLKLEHVTNTAQLSHAFDQPESASDVMIERPFVVKDDAAIEAAARWMAARQVTRMPVVDADEKLVGLLEQSAILGYFADAFVGEVQETSSQTSHHQPVSAGHLRVVGDATLTQVPLVDMAAPLLEVLHFVQETPLRRVIVVNRSGKAVGVIGSTDLLVSQEGAARRTLLPKLVERYRLKLPEDIWHRRSLRQRATAQQVMRPRLITVTLSTPVAQAIQLMLGQKIKRLVVVDETSKPLGLVDRQQLLRSLLDGDMV